MTKPSHENIAVRAYYLWARAGKPSGLDLHFWLIAEFELLHDWHKLPETTRKPRWPHVRRHGLRDF